MGSAASTARWRERHPERAAAYKRSERGKEVARDATARWRAAHPRPRKPVPSPKPFDQWREERAAYMRQWVAERGGIAVCTTYPAKPIDSLCQLCGTHTDLHLDHDHKTGLFRGWLCLQCNMGIGQLGDTVEGLERALTYLKGMKP